MWFCISRLRGNSAQVPNCTLTSYNGLEETLQAILPGSVKRSCLGGPKLNFGTTAHKGFMPFMVSEMEKRGICL